LNEGEYVYVEYSKTALFGSFLPDEMRGKTLKREEDTNEEEETDCGVMDSEVNAAFLCSHAKRPHKTWQSTSVRFQHYFGPLCAC
jgi:hypothetical protein